MRHGERACAVAKKDVDIATLLEVTARSGLPVAVEQSPAAAEEQQD